MKALREITKTNDLNSIEIGSKKWLERLDEVIGRNIENVFLNNEKIAKELQISERQLFRKVKELTKLIPQKYLKKQRLKMAMKFLKNGKYRTVKEAAQAVGYKKSDHFSNQFENQFGKKPYDILRELGWR